MSSPPEPEFPEAADATHLVKSALELLFVAQGQIGGLWLRARFGPVREAIISQLEGLNLRGVRLDANTSDAVLFGGLDVIETLKTTSRVEKSGLLDGSARFATLYRAEQATPSFAAKLIPSLDDGMGLILCDEGVEDEGAPPSLVERTGLIIECDAFRADALDALSFDLEALENARRLFPKILLKEDQIEALVIAALRLGIPQMRAIQHAACAARALAALSGQNEVSARDLEGAAALVLGPRALSFDDPAPEGPSDEDSSEAGETDAAEDYAAASASKPPEDLIIEATLANLPSAFLNAFLSQEQKRGFSNSQGSGAAKKGNRRGRPLPSIKGKLSSGRRIDLLATLRNAAPWQALRRDAAASDAPVFIRSEDIAIKQYQTHSDRLIIFSLDASGSSAVQRLSEAKGAIELLLSEAYVRRDHVAVVSFRKSSAQVLMQPTRSLLQAKRRLRALAGGGGTPLAAGLLASHDLTRGAKKKGMTPSLVLLSDGGANVALDGGGGRAQAYEDAVRAARRLATERVSAITIDTGRRPDPKLAEIATALNATYIPLPNAKAAHLSQTVQGALGL